MDKQRISRSALDDAMLLEVLIPGWGKAVQTVRDQIVSFARHTSARGALLIGPVGSGKSTIARIMALMGYLYYCNPCVRQQIVNNLKFDAPFRLDKQFLSYYEEMNLTGLVRDLAQAQLFGVAKGAATGVSEKPGIFEQAMSGHGKPTKGSEITRGVVFLDEIGDLSPELQPLLLSVLTGAEVYRVGGEGNPAYGYAFNGAVIGATWKNPFDGSLRPDLLSRLASYVIRLPGLNERKDEMAEIIQEMEKDILARHRSRIADLERAGGAEISRERVRSRQSMSMAVDAKAIELLKKQDWAKLGDLRGLRQVLERSFHDQISVSKALEHYAPFYPDKVDGASGLGRSVIDSILSRDRPGSLREEVKRVEKDTRHEVATQLQSDKYLLQRLAAKMGVEEVNIKRQLSDLTRDRSRKAR